MIAPPITIEIKKVIDGKEIIVATRLDTLLGAEDIFKDMLQVLEGKIGRNG